MQKRILFLGGASSQIPPIKYAKEQGHFVITCDYLPDNPAHKLADEYHNISTTDKEAVLALAKKLKIDGIVAYASDPAAPTQAYVGNKLGLPSNPYESVLILSQKDLFREFLKKNHFFTPNSSSFNNYKDAKKWLDKAALPVIVKPIDSSGSKGVTKIDTASALQSAFEYALQFSRKKRIIIEEFFTRSSYQIGGDGFVVNGKLIFTAWTNTHFDNPCNPLVPIGGSLPSVFKKSHLQYIYGELQRLLTLLNMQTGALNYEFQFDQNNTLFIVEVGSRNGGNLIPELIAHATGVDMIKYTVDSALGMDISHLKAKEPQGFYAYYALHALQHGTLQGIWLSEEIKKNIIEELLYIKIGQKVKKCNGSNNTIGIMIMRFFSQEEMLEKMDNMKKYLRVIVN